MKEKRKAKEPAARRQVADSDRVFGTQELKLPKEFIAENNEKREGPLIEKPILVIFLLALTFVAVIAYLVSQK